MVISLKNAAKLIGIILISGCAVFVCTLFINYSMDLVSIKDQLSSEYAIALYDAQVLQGKFICIISGGCLSITSVVMLFFYIKNYIDTHRKELGILKALGYSNLKIASGFWVFGLSIFIGAALGFSLCFLVMPIVYEALNNVDMPEVTIHFHFILVLYLVILPTVLFAFISVYFSFRKLKCPPLDLLREKNQTVPKIRKQRLGKELSFLQELKKSTLRSRTSLIFFIGFASFCYSAMLQMSFSMDELASRVMAVITGSIGIILATTTLFLGITTVVNANTKNISMMRVFGYSLNECSKAILNGYRPIAYIGFAIGTAYQYLLFKIVLDIVFKDVDNIPEYSFDFPVFLGVLISFVIIYEIIMYGYSIRISRISVKEIMLD